MIRRLMRRLSRYETDVLPVFPAPPVDQVDLSEVMEPAAPAADVLRLYVEDFKGFTFLHAVDSGEYRQRFGRDLVLVARNVTGVTINSGKMVYVTGSSANVPTIALARADSAATMPAIGITQEDIGNNAFGRVMIVGLAGLDTSAWNEGDSLYVSDSTAGELTVTPPADPSIRQQIGVVTVQGVGNGRLNVLVKTEQSATLLTHGFLQGLTANDHPQYLLKDGSSPFTGPADLGGFAINNVGLVDGRDVSADGAALDGHVAAAAPHTGVLDLAGTRTMTGDLKMGAKSVTGVNLVDGRDVSVDGGVLDLHVTQIAPHTGVLALDGSRTMTGDLKMGAKNVTGVNLVDGRDVSVDGAALDLHVTQLAPHTGVLALDGSRTMTGELKMGAQPIRNAVSLELKEQTTPGAAPASGFSRLEYDEGEWWMYDDVRGLWLSVERKEIHYSLGGTVSVATVTRGPGNASSQTMGWGVPAEGAVLIGYWFRIAGGTVTNTTIRIRRSATLLHPVVFTSATILESRSLNVALTAGWQLNSEVDPTTAAPTDSPNNTTTLLYVRRKRP